MNDVNPFRAPAADIAPVKPDETPAEAMRRTYLDHETSIRAIATLFLCGAAASAIVAVTGAALAVDGATGGKLNRIATGVAAALIGSSLCALLTYTGIELRRFNPAVRRPFGVVVVVALVAMPLGLYVGGRWLGVPFPLVTYLGLIVALISTLINGYALHLVLSKEGSVVFSEAYRRVRMQTPHVRYGVRRTVRDVTTLLFLVAVFVLLIVMGL